MKKTILLSYLALFIVLGFPLLLQGRSLSLPEASAPAAAESPAPETSAAPAPLAASAGEPAPDSISVLTDGGAVTMDMQEYLVGVVAAEMPASFQDEALKAQAVAARTYAMYCAKGQKHGEAQVCTDYACCQAWQSDEALRQKWGGDYDTYSQKIRAAVEATAGQYLSYAGQPVFAAFHSSSAGATEDCGQVWNPSPYLVSVSSPETAEDVPNYISTVECTPLDFRDTLLYAHPDADFTGEESGWIGEIRLDGSGRVASAVLGGVSMKGTELRQLFSLRSTAFQLEYTGESFRFTVTGYGHGVGMSQYGANVMAREGETYTGILAHYYPGTVLVS